MHLTTTYLLLRKNSQSRMWPSDYANSFNLPVSPVAKLIETPFDKQFYICNFRNLKILFGSRSQGQQTPSCSADQSCWLGNYISKNTIMRKNATTDFEKNFFKLLSSACFSKTMENLRQKRDTKFVANTTEANRYTLKPNFLTFQIIRSNLVSLNFSKTSLFLNKPTPVGAAILDLSKIGLDIFH